MSDDMLCHLLIKSMFLLMELPSPLILNSLMDCLKIESI